MEAFTIRAYREGDELEINRLFNEIFGANRSLDEWRWKFRDNPASVMTAAIAESAGRIIGQYPEVTSIFKYLDKRVTFSMPVDNFILPDFRGGINGVQRAMFEFRNRQAARLGVPAGFGFPTKAHYIIGKRLLKYWDLAEMPVLFMRLNLRLAARSRIPGIPSFLLAAIRLANNRGLRMFMKVRHIQATLSLRTRIVEAFDARVDALWERLKDKHGIVCVRDRRYLDWRYSKPGADYRIIIAEQGSQLLGYAVTAVSDQPQATVGYVVDLFADDLPEVLDALAIHSVLELLSRNADYALCWMLPDKSAYRALRGIGFAERKTSFPPVNVVYKTFDPQIDDAVVRDPRNWFLTMGDSDVY